MNQAPDLHRESTSDSKSQSFRVPDLSKSGAIGYKSQSRVNVGVPSSLPKKVLFLITKATWGGAQRYVFDLATHLPKEKFEAVVAYGESGKLATDLKNAGIETYQIPSLGRDIAVLSDIRSLFEVWKCIRTTRPDVIHLNSSKAAALGALAARLSGVPKIIFTVHGWPFKEDRGVLARELIRFISWFTALLSNEVIVVSKQDEELGQNMWLVDKKVHYIPIGIATPTFLTREEASAALSITTTLPRIVTIAELTPNKGIRYAIGAVALLRKQGVDIDYSIISPGEELERLEILAQELNVADRVHFLGFVGDAAKYLKAFDIFLLPSIKEGMPYVLLEAAEAGLPVITTNVVNPDVFDRLQNIRLVPPADPEAIVDAIVKTAGQKGSDISNGTLFSLSEMLEKTSALYC